MYVKDVRDYGENCECKDTRLCKDHVEAGIQNKELFKKKSEKRDKKYFKEVPIN